MLANARTLRIAAQAGKIPPLLRGRKLGLLCEAAAADADTGAAALFRRAAVELGAHVAQAPPACRS